MHHYFDASKDYFEDYIQNQAVDNQNLDVLRAWFYTSGSPRAAYRTRLVSEPAYFVSLMSMFITNPCQ